MKYYIEFVLVSLIVSEILESAKLPASAKLPFLPLLGDTRVIIIIVTVVKLSDNYYVMRL